MAEPAIADYGLIGDGRTAALSSSRGSIDWLCLPRFDSEPVFGRLVGGDGGGSFAISVDGVQEVTRRYRDRSAVLETRWRTGTSEVRLTEGMVLDISSTLMPQLVLVRHLEAAGTPTTVRLLFDPRRGLPGISPRTERRRDTLLCSWGSLTLGLLTHPEISLLPAQERQVSLDPGSPLTFVVSLADREPLVLISAKRALEGLEATDRWWRTWCEGIEYHGPFEESVIRSLITLRLLTYSPSGAPVAAPTTSLPESIGGSRNWDYRYSWPRDASLGLRAFLAVGKPDEARSFIHWLLHASRLTRPRLGVLYTLDGNPGPREREVPGVSGYRGSRPVRIGNAACDQHQLDIYGWVLDAGWGLVQSGYRLHAETWRAMGALADFVAENWGRPDAGIWESRDEPKHFVHSKVMGWVALDRALRIAQSHRTRKRRAQRWEAERAALARDVRHRGFHPERGAYVRSYGSEELDAALLLMPASGFEEPSSPRLKETISGIERELLAEGPLMYRYPPGTDGLSGREGAFIACSFWLVDALVRTGRPDDARALFADLCARSNEVGLFAEEIDPGSREFVGNFPQALSHAALVHAALALSEEIAVSRC